MNARYATLAFLAFAALAVVLTLPLVLHLSTHIPSPIDHEGDGPIFLWNMWWFKYSLFTLHSNPFLATTIFFPQQPSLAFHTLNTVQSILSLPLQTFLPIQAAFNIVYLLGIVLSGFFTYLLAVHLTRHQLGSFLAGVIFAFNPAVTARGLGHFNLTTVWIIPLYVLYLFISFPFFLADRSNPRDKRSDHRRFFFSLASVGLAGFVLGLQYWNDSYYFSYLIGFTFFFFLFFGWMRHRQLRFLRVVLGIMVFSLAFVVTVAPLLSVQLPLQHDYLKPIPLKDIAFYSPDVVKLILPSLLNPLLGHVTEAFVARHPIYRGEGAHIETLYLGLSVFFFASLGFIFRKSSLRTMPAKMFFLLVALTFLILSLGPSLRFLDRTLINEKLPYAFLAQLPVVNNLRVPTRAIIMTYFGLGVLVAFSFRMFRPRLLWFIFPAALISVSLEYNAIPRQIARIEPSAVYQQIPADGSTILDIPFGVNSGLRSDGFYSSYLQSYQMWHHHPLLGGAVSRIPDRYIDFYRSPSLQPIEYLLFARDHDPACCPRTPIVLNTLRHLNINFIVLHTRYFSIHKKEEIELYLIPLASPVGSSPDGEGEALLYRVRNELLTIPRQPVLLNTAE